MDTRDVAAHLGTTPRILRQFLRSSFSTFAAVGSGGRYDFTERDVATLKKRFTEWRGAGKPKPAGEGKPKSQKKDKAKAQRERDEAEWQDEGDVVLEDIRDPRVRRRVQLDAEAAEERLMLVLLSKGVHITQLGDRRAS